MDWSKAKNIIIAALIAANLFLGYMYFSQLAETGNEAQKANEYTAQYLQLLGSSLNCDLPKESEKLPVVFVEIRPGSNMVYETKEGRRVLVTGQSGVCAVPTGYGDTKAGVISSSDAVRRLASSLSDRQLSGLLIEQVLLVYRVDRTGLGEEQMQDTAVPSWEIVTSRGTYYQDAFKN